MSFNSVGKPIGEYLLNAKKSRFDVVCKNNHLIIGIIDKIYS